VKKEAIPEWAEGLYYNKGSSQRYLSTMTTSPFTLSAGAKIAA
jgi:hypothetical protein